MSSLGGSHPRALAEPYVTVFPSYGSRRSALGEGEHEPMGEESGLSLASSVQPVPGPGELAPESLELLHGPSYEVFVDVACKGSTTGSGRRLRRGASP